MKSIKIVCSACQNCCKKYNITLLPKEAKRIALNLNLREKAFIEEYCDLTLQFFPAFNSKNFFVLSKKNITKKIQEKLKNHSNSSYFFVLPNISLKNNKKCVFLEKGLCRIHSVKPEQCRLFPFISLKKETSFWKKYPFCKLLEKGFQPEKDFKQKSEKHYRKITRNFDGIQEKGFTFVWKNLPKTGNAFFKDKKICKITKNDFLKIIESFK